MNCIQEKKKVRRTKTAQNAKKGQVLLSGTEPTQQTWYRLANKLGIKVLQVQRPTLLKTTI